MFFYNPKHNFLFVNIPLEIGALPQTIRMYLPGEKEVTENKYKDLKKIPPYYCHSTEIKNRIGDENWDNTYTFGIVRNPFDYIIAMWEYYTASSAEKIAWCRGIKDQSEAVREQHRLKSRGFTKWLLEDRDYDYLHSFPFCGDRLTSQTVWLSDVNDIFSFEQTTPLLAKLFELTKITIPSFKGGVPKRKELQSKRASYFGQSKEAVDLIADSFKREIEMFNYECF